MTSRVMMGLGAFRFGIDTAAYETLTRECDMGWNSVPRAQNLPAYQATSLGSETLALKGTIYPGFLAKWQNGPGAGRRLLSRGVKRGIIDDMRAQGRQRVRLPMVSGYGKWLGMWVIMTVKEEDTRFFSDGVERKQNFDMSLEFTGMT